MPIGRSDIAAGYLAGIIDGEGSIAYYPNNKVTYTKTLKSGKEITITRRSRI